MIRSPFVTSSAVAMVISTAATAQFSDAYAPDTWTTTGVGIGGASVVFAADGSQLALTGGDGAGAQTTAATHTVVGSGTWSFDWSFISFNGSPGFDVAYYLHNGTAIYLSVTRPGGHIDVPVKVGDVIGWQMTTFDGIFGPAVLTITNFQIPAPGIVAILSLAGLVGSRRRE